MGLDVILGAVVLLAGARGWFRGFFLQATRLGALVGCVYAADPLRDLTRPYARSQVPTMRPELLDKLLWWTAAVVFYVVVSGIAAWIIQAYKRRAHHDFNQDQADQGAGFLLGTAKGLVYASFLAAGMDRYATSYLTEVGWAQEQVKASHAMAWARAYHPADRIWESRPVRRFVAQVRRGGVEMPEAPSEAKPDAPSEAQAPPFSRRLEVPQPRTLDPSDPSFLRDLDEQLRGEDALKRR